MASGGMVNRFGAVARYLAALAVASTFCAALSYGLVRYFTRGVAVYTRPDERALHEAIELRESSQVLAELTRDFMSRADLSTDSVEYQKWLERDFQPGLNSLRDRMVHGPEQYESVGPLLRAADALHATAAGPRNAQRRDQAARTVLEAILEAERRVGELGVSPNKLPPPVPAPEPDGG